MEDTDRLLTLMEDTNSLPLLTEIGRPLTLFYPYLTSPNTI